MCWVLHIYHSEISATSLGTERILNGHFSSTGPKWVIGRAGAHLRRRSAAIRIGFGVGAGTLGGPGLVGRGLSGVWVVRIRVRVQSVMTGLVVAVRVRRRKRLREGSPASARGRAPIRWAPGLTVDVGTGRVGPGLLLAARKQPVEGDAAEVDERRNHKHPPPVAQRLLAASLTVNEFLSH